MPVEDRRSSPDRRNTGSRIATDWDAYHRVRWQRHDTLDPELRVIRINAKALTAAPKRPS
jgi:hypothetical protein